jgi:integrase
VSREALEKAYRVTLGLAGIHSPHGWRSSMTSNALDHGFDREVVLTSTDHTHDTEVALAYDRAERFEQRIALFKWWGEQLVHAQAGGKASRAKSTMTEGKVSFLAL